ncbi:EF-hand domain-containing protein [Sphingobium nicotianae]|uniref:EF-hand domain-containing protein n=1 Tax=Sphingobium nicotianae TaxID=2782607 RepID=A0A9X1DBV8_9SPHN|nr:EF-hand domain-containing protein [Sphingobium nicotianae]MBT2187086.1 EF-hand domain-containing protein [Sphingobium nicotianae]
MSHRPHMLLLGAGLLSLGAAALAQPPAPPPAMRGMGGPVMAPPANRAELKAQLEQRFDATDANHDGTVTPEELKAKRLADRQKMRAEMRDRMFAQLDTDKNGSISKAEFDAAHGPGQDHPGMGSPDARGPVMDGNEHDGHGMRAHRSMRRHMGRGAMMHDGFGGFKGQPVTKTAFVDAGLARFDKADTDHDGKISPAERDVARKAMRDRFAPANRPAPPPPGQ